MKFNKTIVLFLTAGMLLFTSTTFGWGRAGHHIIAEIAQSIMNEHARENVQKYLGSTSFEEASVWILLLMSIGNLKKQQFNTSGCWFY